MFRQTVFGVDTLITQVSSKELLHYNGAVGKVLWVERSGMCSCNSVFDCNFPKVVIQDESERGIFYLSYLYRLKIQELYDNKDLAPMERLRQLFFYMSEVIGVIGDIELQLGKMLFIGDKYASTASSILKIDGKRNIQTINNSVADIVLFRIAQRTGSLSPFPVYFVSGDTGLQKLFSLNRTLIAGVGVASLSEDSSDVHENLWNEWEDFYNSYVESRKFLAFAQPYFIEQHFDDIVRKINEEIVILEDHLFK